MNIRCQLDYPTILINQAQPIYAVLKLTADKRASNRQTPLAFCAVLDRSGSMAGQPLEYAKQACETVVRNLGPDDFFSLVVFDSEAQVVFPLQKITRRGELLARIRAIQTGGNTNLTGGWMLGRDELTKAPAGVPRRILLLTDGQLNAGIVEPRQVERIVSGGLELDRVRTTCLGFGDGYAEDLLRQLAKCSGGDFYDADSPDKLPAIFQVELQGLQQISAQNVRVRLRPLDFCESLVQLSDYTVTVRPDGRVELAVGDLISGEERVLVLLAQASPLPHGALPEGEKFLELEIVWDEIDGREVQPRCCEKVVRLAGTQNPGGVVLNEETVAWISVQRAGRVLDEATRDIDAGRREDAMDKLRQAIATLRRYRLDERTADGIRLLERLLARLESGEYSIRDRKKAAYASSFVLRCGSAKAWSGPASETPAFSEMECIEERIGKRPTLPPE